ncbi:RPS6KC1 [Branchiostoma lanceolatum]|uniref:RPS6KC1 protein n=1 Tax=Branchiostoma lanceolatum TaxID=7740 RepID=A0A8J9ZW83_BRALA|nr:RPS6KC1 [Branchiostoma lanceolatum]
MPPNVAACCTNGLTQQLYARFQSPHQHPVAEHSIKSADKFAPWVTEVMISTGTFPRGKADADSEVVVWKRYNDFKKLHKALFARYKHLARSEPFPTFAKAKIFGRFDEAVVEERRQSALQLLEFVGKIPYLAASSILQTFFEGGLQVDPEGEQQVLREAVLQPDVVSAVPADVDETEEDNRESPQQESEGIKEPSLGGVWLHKTADDNISLHSDDMTCSDDDATTFTDDSMPNTPLPSQEEMSFFDPLNKKDLLALPEEEEVEGEGTLRRSNSWLLRAMDECTELASGSSAEDGGEYSNEGLTMRLPKEDVATDVANYLASIDNSSAADSGIVESPQHDSQSGAVENSPMDSPWAPSRQDSFEERSRHWQGSVARAYLDSVRHRSRRESGQQGPGADKTSDSDDRVDGIVVASATPVHVHNRVRALSGRSVGSFDLGAEMADYIHEAAQMIRLALENEACGGFEAAFGYYKSGVEMLLRGVQNDTNKTRREAVRRKTAQYLLRAEDLYNRHLPGTTANSNRWAHSTFGKEYGSRTHITTSGLAPCCSDCTKLYGPRATGATLCTIGDEGRNFDFDVVYSISLKTTTAGLIAQRPEGKPTRGRTGEEGDTDSADLDSVTAHLCGPTSDLQNYKVIGVVDKVALVIDMSTNNTYVIKVLQKDSGDHTCHRSVVPARIPYMVQLYCYYTTEHAVFLVLEYAAGGKLWSSISGYLHQHSTFGQDSGGFQERSLEEGSHPSHGRTSSTVDHTSAASSNKTLSPKHQPSLKSVDNQLPENGTSPEDLLLAQIDKELQLERTADERRDASAVSMDDDLMAGPEPVSSYVNLFHQYEKERDRASSFSSDLASPYSDEYVFDDRHRSATALSSDSLISPVKLRDRDSSFLSDVGDVTTILAQEDNSDEPMVHSDSGTFLPSKVPTADMEVFSIESMEEEDFTSVLEHNKKNEEFRSIYDSVVAEESEMEREPFALSESDELGTEERQHVDIREEDLETDAATSESEHILIEKTDVKCEDEDIEVSSHNETGLNDENIHGMIEGARQDFPEEELESGLELNRSEGERTVSEKLESEGTGPSECDDQTVANEHDVRNKLMDSCRPDPMDTDGRLSKTEPEGETGLPRTMQGTGTLVSEDVSGTSQTSSLPLEGGIVSPTMPQSDSAEVPPVEDESNPLSEEQGKVLDQLMQMRPAGRKHSYKKGSYNIRVNPLEEMDREEEGEEEEVFKLEYPPVRLDINPNDTPILNTGTFSTTVALEGDAKSSVMIDKDPVPSLPVTPVKRRSSSGTSSGTKSPGYISPRLSPQQSPLKQTSSGDHRKNSGGSQREALDTSRPEVISNKSQKIHSAEDNLRHVPDTSEQSPEHHNIYSGRRDESYMNKGEDVPARKRTTSVLFSHLDKSAKSFQGMTLPEPCVRQWAAEIVVALSKLHTRGIICRDLSPDNVLLSDRGHIRLTYFSQWTSVDRSFSWQSSQQLYVAPEVASVFRVTPACDWWSLGALLFELLTGKTLLDCHPAGITSHTSLNIPEHVSAEARSLLEQLLQPNVSERLGSGIDGAEDIKAHPFFKDINWEELRE